MSSPTYSLAAPAMTMTDVGGIVVLPDICITLLTAAREKADRR